MIDVYQDTVAEAVVKNYKTADVFKKHGIDFCCGGKKKISDVCAQKSIDPTAMANELAGVTADNAGDSNDYEKWGLGFLADYIVNVHHAYVTEAVPRIREYIGKVARVHGHYYGETIRIAELFDQVAAELHMHMMKEERVLFPYIKAMEEAYKQSGTVETPPFQTVENPIAMMLHDHDAVGAMYKEIRELSNNFAPPADACNTYRVSYAKLEEFETDLHKHIHLENNILFDKAIALEKKMRETA